MFGAVIGLAFLTVLERDLRAPTGSPHGSPGSRAAGPAVLPSGETQSLLKQ